MPGFIQENLQNNSNNKQELNVDAISKKLESHFIANQLQKNLERGTFPFSPLKITDSRNIENDNLSLSVISKMYTPLHSSCIIYFL